MEEHGASARMGLNEGEPPEAGPRTTESPKVSHEASTGWAWLRPTPTVLTWQDVADLPRQILPEETYRHCKNARTEAVLALFSLWKSINNSRKGSSGQPRHRRIEVE